MNSSASSDENLKAKRGRRKFFRYATIALLGFLLVSASIYLYQNRSIFAEIDAKNLYLLGLAIPLYGATIFAKSFSFDIISALFGVRMRVFDSICLTVSSLLSNYALPGNTGMAIRTVYMDRVKGVSYREYFPAILNAFIFSTGLYAVVSGILGLLHDDISSLETFRALFVVMAAVGAAGIVVLSTVGLWITLVTPLEKLMRVIFEGWKTLMQRRDLFALWLLNEFARGFLEISFMLSVFAVMGLEVGFWEAAIMVLVKENAIFFRITPGAIGVAEGVYMAFAALFGLDPALVLAASILSRVIELLVLSTLSLLFTKRFLERTGLGSS